MTEKYAVPRKPGIEEPPKSPLLPGFAGFGAEAAPPSAGNWVQRIREITLLDVGHGVIYAHLRTNSGLD